MDSLKKIDSYITKKDLITQFKKIGVKPGMILEVHSSLSSFGYVVGGARSIVDALLEIVGEDGTICMPLQESSNTEPSYWMNPPIAHELMQEVRVAMPAFDGHRSDGEHMGRVVENFRLREGVLFSQHPSVAFVAYGRYAKLLCNRQSLHFPLSEESPLARMYELDASILLLGVGYEHCTAFHLAEHRSDERDVVLDGGSVVDNGVTIWKKYLDLELDNREFETIGKMLEKYQLVESIMVADAKCRLFSMRKAIDIAERYFRIL